MKYIRQFIICLIFLFIISTRLYSGLVIMWTQQYDGGNGNDEARGIAIDNAGYVYVTGFKHNDSGNDDYFTIKYSNNGNTIWTQQYNCGNSDQAYGIAVDNLGYVYVTGGGNFGTDHNYFTIKYSNNGFTIWTQQYDGGNDWDHANEIAVDNSGYVYVTGCKDNGPDYEYLTLKYDSSGNTIWTQQYDGGNGSDCAKGIAVDNSGYVYVTGWKFADSNVDYFTIKYDSSGNTIWTQQYDGGTNELAYGIAVNNSGYVYVTGVKYNGIDADYFTIKYDSDGNTIWTQQYDGGNGNDEANGIAVDDMGYVYVTGYKRNGSGNDDYFIIKYDSNGNIIWTQQYDGENGSDCANGIAVDDMGYVYVTGYKRNGSGNNDYFTIKYLQPPYPDPPSFLLGSSEAYYVKLVWQDNTINESGFKIYRSGDGIDYNVIGRTSTNIVQFMDTSILKGGDYWYKVTATNKAGETVPSNIVMYKFTKIDSLDEIVLVPNPFNPNKSKKDYITYFNVPDDIKIEIYNILGEKLKELSNPDSEHRIKWYGTDSGGKMLSRGFYIARLEDSKGNKRHIKFVIQR